MSSVNILSGRATKLKQQCGRAARQLARHCSDMAHPLWASVSHLWEDTATLEVPFEPAMPGPAVAADRLLCFHAQLLWLASLGSALFCFHCWTYYRRTPGSAAGTTAEASSFAQFLDALVTTEKVGKGQLAEATEKAAHDSHRSSGKVGARDSAVCRALSLTKVAFGTHRHKGFPRSFPSGQSRQL